MIARLQGVASPGTFITLDGEPDPDGLWGRSPLRVIRVGFAMSALGPIYPQQQTI